LARLGLGAMLSIVATLGAMPQASAQIDQIDEATDALQETTDQVKEVVDQTTGGLNETVESAGDGANDSVGGAAGGLSDSVQQTTGGVTGLAGSVAGNASDAAGDAGGTSGGRPGETVTETGRLSAGTTHQARGRDASGSRIRSAPARAPGSARMARVLGASGEGWSGAIYVPLLVRLTNDADGDGVYSDSETARRQDEDVPFQVRLENVGSNELAVLAVRGVSPTPTGMEEDAACRDLAGIRLGPGESTTCRFTVSGLAPPVGERVVRLFEVDAVDTTDPSRTGTVVDATVIRTGSVLGEFIRRGLDALASTGARIIVLLAIAAVLAGIGGPFVLLGNRRRRYPDQDLLPWAVGNHPLGLEPVFFPSPGSSAVRRSNAARHRQGSLQSARVSGGYGKTRALGRSDLSRGLRTRLGCTDGDADFRSPSTRRRYRS
jgi:hypothetical protein